ncbi:MAG: transglycosylase domain-containing protein [Bacteroidota bacterium]
MQPKQQLSVFNHMWKTRLKKAGKYLLIASGVGAALIVIFYFLVLGGAFGHVPTKEELSQINNAEATDVFAADGSLLGKYFLENRTQIQFEQISPKLIQALIATEDARFYDHAGVDMRSMMRVAFKSVLMGDASSGGGSTLSQQLAKNLFPRKSYWMMSLPINKVREMIVARRLEKVYSKAEILTYYLNTVSFGEDVFGVNAATQRFFNVNPLDIKVQDAAAVVGMLKATTSYNPYRNPERAKNRRDVVLEQMVKYGYLQDSEADSLQALDLQTDYQYVSSNQGPAPYFRQELAEQLKQILADNPKEDGSPYNLYTDGLKIYTSIDARLQKYAEAAVGEHMKGLQKSFDKHWAKRKIWKTDDPEIVRAMQSSARYRQLKAQGKSETEIREHFAQPIKMSLPSWEGNIEREISPLDSIVYAQSFLHAGFMAMEPQSGYIRAWVGGINFEHYKFDHVTSRRQVGSTFKPFVYAAAIEQGIDPCEYIPNELVVYDDYDDWAPGNSNDEYEGYYSLQGALTNSVNTVSATVMMKVGVENAASFAERMGFSSPLPHEPSLVLGTADLSLMEMVGAYSAFANKGVRVRPMFLLRVEDKNGNTIVDYSRDIERTKVMERKTASMMLEMLQTVVDSGTAKRIRYNYLLKGEMGGKTGTTQDQTDGWFMGVTPNLVCGVWVGGDNRKVRFRSLGLGQGANTALPIYARFMQKVHRDRKYRQIKNAKFPDPSMEIQDEMDCVMFRENIDDQFDRIDDVIQLLLEKQRERRLSRDSLRQDRRRDRQNQWEKLFERKRRQPN